jgi:hypothetical protein
MAHFPNPFYCPAWRLWYVEIKGRQHNLGPDKDDAFKKYHQIMQMPEPVASVSARAIFNLAFVMCSASSAGKALRR